MRIAWWITKATDTHSEYVLLEIFALLVCYASYIGSYLSTFRDNLSVASLRAMHPEYVILFAFPRQQWLRERASVYVIRTLPPGFGVFEDGLKPATDQLSYTRPSLTTDGPVCDVMLVQWITLCHRPCVTDPKKIICSAM